MRFFTNIFITICVFSAFFCAPPLYGAKNEVVSFGETEGFTFVIAFPQNPRDPDSPHFSRAEAFFKAAEERGETPDARISLVLTKNDYSRLPEGLRPGVPEGAEEVISMLRQGGSGAVILVLPEEKPGVTTIKCGAKYASSPPELLNAAAKALEENGAQWRLEEKSLELYRIGWMQEDHILAAYLNAGIPAVALCSSGDLSRVLFRAVEILAAEETDTAFADRHYVLLSVPNVMRKAAEKAARFFYRYGGVMRRRSVDDASDADARSSLHMNRFFIVREGPLVAAVICCSSFFLLYLCLFTFLHPETRRKKRRELLQALPHPFLYSALNIIALYAGERAASFLFYLRFGKTDAWILLPRVAFFMKLSVAFLFTVSFTTTKNSPLFPRNPQMLGYIAAMASFVNIFVFSALEFSLAPYFILCFLSALFSVYSKNKILQGVFTVFFAAVFIHFYRQIFQGNVAALSALYNGERGWNIWAAFFIVPIQLMLSRILVRAAPRGGKTALFIRANLAAKIPIRAPSRSKPDRAIYIPILPACAFLCALFFASIIFFARAWSDKNPLRLTVNQNITDEAKDILISGPADPGDIHFTESRSAAFPPFADVSPEDFVSVDFSSRLFLDRMVYELTVEPKIAARRIDILISSPEGIAVHTASLPFEFEAGGSSAFFATGESPDIPLHVNFVTGSSGPLFAEISFWSVENPYGLTIDESDIFTDHLLFVRRKIALRNGG